MQKFIYRYYKQVEPATIKINKTARKKTELKVKKKLSIYKND